MNNFKIILILFSALYICNAYGSDCANDELRFAFRNIETLSALAIIADFAKLKPEFDHSIKSSGPLNFDCTNWRTAAENIARDNHLTLNIENGVIRVTK